MQYESVWAQSTRIFIDEPKAPGSMHTSLSHYILSNETQTHFSTPLFVKMQGADPGLAEISYSLLPYRHLLPHESLNTPFY